MHRTWGHIQPASGNEPKSYQTWPLSNLSQRSQLWTPAQRKNEMSQRQCSLPDSTSYSSAEETSVDHTTHRDVPVRIATKSNNCYGRPEGWVSQCAKLTLYHFWKELHHPPPRRLKSMPGPVSVRGKSKLHINLPDQLSLIPGMYKSPDSAPHICNPSTSMGDGCQR